MCDSLGRMPKSAQPPRPHELEQVTVQTRGGSLQERTSGYTLDSRTLGTHNFLFISEGEVVWELDGQAVSSGVGGLYRVPKGAVHRAWSTTQRVRIISLHVEVRLPNGLDAFERLRPPQLLTDVRGTRLVGWFEEAAMEMRHDGMTSFGRRLLSGFGHLVTHGYLQICAERDLLHPTTEGPVVEEILSMVHAGWDKPLDLASLAARAGYSPQYLNRLFTRQVGATPLRIHHRLRMERAAQLLLDEPLTAAAVGEALGFGDPAHFSRVFKRHFGCGPAEYRASAHD